MQHIKFEIIKSTLTIIHIIIFVLIQWTVFAQKPIDLGADKNISLCPPACDTLKASVIPNKTTDDYKLDTIPYAPMKFDTGTVVVAPYNAIGKRAIGFTFCYWGNPYDSVYIGSNGWLGFSPGQDPTFGCATCMSTGVSIPNSTKAPKNAIMLRWSQLGLWSVVPIFYGTYGTAPYRKFVVSFYNSSGVPPGCFNAHDMTTFGGGQIVLYETTNVIELFIKRAPHCKTMDTISYPAPFGVQGLHNIDGTKAFPVPDRNNTRWTAYNDGRRFTPNSINASYAINWFKTDTSATNLIASDTSQISVCPLINTAYIGQLIRNSCPADTFYDTVVVNTSGTNGDATITPDTFCISDPSDTLKAASPGGTWYGTGITDTSAGIFNPGTAGAGSHQIVYILSGACSDTDTAYIVITSKLDATINPTGSPYCSTASGFNLTAVSGGGVWSGTGITDTITGTFSPSTASGGTHTITYTISGSCGDTKTRNIVVDTVIKATIYAKTFCPADPAANITVDNPGKGVWSGGGGGLTSTTLGTFDPSKVAVGTYTVTYTITSGACTDAGTATVTITNSANSAITPVGPFCEYDDTLTLKAATSGGTWTGTGIINGSKGLFSPDTAEWGTHTITYTIAGGCGSVSTTTISVDSIANAGFYASAYCKLDFPDTLSLKAVNKSGVWSGNGITNTTLGIFTPSSVAIGIHPVKHVTTNGKCKDSSIVNIKVDSILLATITPVNPVCIGNSLVMLQGATNGGYWTGNGIKDSTQGSFDPNLAGVGTHSITYTIVSQCGNTDSINITVNDTPSVTLTIINESCPGECDGSITDSVYRGIPPYTHSWSNGETANAVTNLCADIYYSVTVMDNANCEGKTGGVVSSTPAPVADFNISPTVATIPNTLITFTDNSSSGITQWQWTFYDINKGSELGTSTDASVTMFEYPQVIGYYPVLMEIWDANNCKADTIKNVFINGEYAIYVPNAFTPNGDATNDKFVPKGIGVNKYKLYIFDRWGELIFESNNLHTYWDGTYKGQLVQNGVYIWKIITEEETLDKTKHQYVGHVTVLK